VDRATADLEIQPLYCCEAAELLGQTAGLENYVVHA